MFNNYVAAKTVAMPRWAPPLITAVVVSHALFFVGLWISDQWKISLLPVPKNSLEVAVGAPPPPPPPPPPAGKKSTPKTDTPKKTVIKETVQPVQNNEPTPDVVAETETDEGVQGGVEGGVTGGVLGGVIGGVEGGVVAAAPPPPPKAAEPEFMAPSAVEAQRIFGEKDIRPDDNTKTAIGRSGTPRITAIAKFCLNASGVPTTVTIQKPSGYPSYDAAIKTAVKQWRYKPFSVGGKPAAICSTVTFIYTQK